LSGSEGRQELFLGEDTVVIGVGGIEIGGYGWMCLRLSLGQLE